MLLIRCCEMFLSFSEYVYKQLHYYCSGTYFVRFLKIQRVSWLGSNGNISLLGEKTVLRRNVFTMEEHGKGNEVP